MFVKDARTKLMQAELDTRISQEDVSLIMLVGSIVEPLSLDEIRVFPRHPKFSKFTCVLPGPKKVSAFEFLLWFRPRRPPNR
jgi:hypothetical protein